MFFDVIWFERHVAKTLAASLSKWEEEPIAFAIDRKGYQSPGIKSMRPTQSSRLYQLIEVAIKPWIIGENIERSEASLEEFAESVWGFLASSKVESKTYF